MSTGEYLTMPNDWLEKNERVIANQAAALAAGMQPSIESPGALVCSYLGSYANQPVIIVFDVSLATHYDSTQKIKVSYQGRTRYFNSLNWLHYWLHQTTPLVPEEHKDFREKAVPLPPPSPAQVDIFHQSLKVHGVEDLVDYYGVVYPTFHHELIYTQYHEDSGITVTFLEQNGQPCQKLDIIVYKDGQYYSLKDTDHLFYWLWHNLTMWAETYNMT